MADCCDDQKPFECSICLQLLKDPVTTACGHSFCMNCIKEFWDVEHEREVYSCPQCRQIFSPRPALNRSTVLTELIEKMKGETPQAVEATPVTCSAQSADVDCDVCMENKLKAIKFCLACMASYCETHIQTHYTSLALKRHKLVNASPHLLGQICSQHDKPLELYCSRDQQLICMQCALINHQNHSMTSPAAKRQEMQGQLKLNQHGLQEKIHQREMKVQEIKQVIDSHKQSAQAAVEHSEKIVTELISSLEKKQAEITEKIRNQEKAEESKAEKLIRSLKQEIGDLKKQNEELGQLSQTDDDVYFIQNFSSINYQCSDLRKITVNKHLTFEEIQPILSELKSQVDDLCEQDTFRISEKVLTAYIILNDEKIPKYLPSRPKTREEFLTYSSKLFLNDPLAGSQLSISNNNSCVSRNPLKSTSQSPYGSYSNRQKYGRAKPAYGDFGYQTSTYQVLCRESLSGCCYFEVEYTGTGCSIAFSYDQCTYDQWQEEGNVTFGCNNRSWIFDFSMACINMSHTNVSTSSPIVSSKIGVYLDHSAGTLSFYSVSDKMTLLHRVQVPFTEPLYPGFSLEKWENGSVRICDLSVQPK